MSWMRPSRHSAITTKKNYANFVLGDHYNYPPPPFTSKVIIYSNSGILSSATAAAVLKLLKDLLKPCLNACLYAPPIEVFWPFCTQAKICPSTCNSFSSNCSALSIKTEVKNYW